MGHRISWPSAASLLYAIDERVLPGTNWCRIASSIPGTPPLNIYLNLFADATNQSAVYRVVVQDD
jgi:hypothetical protein